MKLPGNEIAQILQESLKKEVAELTKEGLQPKLVDVLIGESPEQISFVKIKQALAAKLGISFQFLHLLKSPSFEEFARILKERSHDETVTGIIVQQPLPHQLQTDSMYNFIPFEKEIEGHKLKSCFLPPLGLATLTALKYIYNGNQISPELFIDLPKDTQFFKSNLRNKKIIIVGRGITGGQPIGQVLNKLKINYLSIDARTFEPEQYYKDADIIITAVGKKILTPTMIKAGAILLNAGLRRENDKLKGDYDGSEMKDTASFYTPTPGGIGPIDVIYLYKNLIEATKMQF